MLLTQAAVPAISIQRNTHHSYQKTNPYNEPSNQQYPEEPPAQRRDWRANSAATQDPFVTRPSTPQHLGGRSPGLMNGFAGSTPQPVMYVRALYDYEADDRTSLSFHEGDVIHVITQLESGWWDGVINGVRGWFPSNYCQVVTGPDDIIDGQAPGEQEEEEEDTEEDEYEEEYEDDESETEPMELPLSDRSNATKAKADFWIPQATADGRLYYFNTMTGESVTELPLDSPSSSNETGPRDRMNVNVPEKTRPPPEIMARGYVQEEDDESDVNSASEAEGESLMLASTRSSVVRIS